jgi:hypothetical protein
MTDRVAPTSAQPSMEPPADPEGARSCLDDLHIRSVTAFARRPQQALSTGGVQESDSSSP